MPIVNVQRRVDGNLVYGSVNEVTNEQNGETKPPQFNVPGAVAAPSDALLDSIGNLEVSIYCNFIDKPLISLSFEYITIKCNFKLTLLDF